MRRWKARQNGSWGDISTKKATFHIFFPFSLSSSVTMHIRTSSQMFFSSYVRVAVSLVSRAFVFVTLHSGHSIIFGYGNLIRQSERLLLLLLPLLSRYQNWFHWSPNDSWYKNVQNEYRCTRRNGGSWRMEKLNSLSLSLFTRFVCVLFALFSFTAQKDKTEKKSKAK